MTRLEVEELVAAKGKVLHRYLLRTNASVADEALGAAYEILWRSHTRLDADTARSWLFVVARREAVRLYADEKRKRPLTIHLLPEDDLAHDGRNHALVLDAKATLAALKPDEAHALLLLGVGYSYNEICDRTGWSYTKVNRCIAEGRRSAKELLAA